MTNISILKKDLEKIISQLAELTSISNAKVVYRWISKEEAMKVLKIKSKTTLQKLRDENSIIFTNVNSKIILYDLYSIAAFLENSSNNKLI